MPKKPISPASGPDFPALSPAARPTFYRILANPKSMRAYFVRHLDSFFPGAQTLKRYAYTHRPTLSTTSYLTRFTVVVGRDRKQQTYHVRGNSIDRHTAAIFHRVGRPAGHVRMPRPLAYFSRPGYIFYEEVAGKTLRELSLSSRQWPTTLRLVAKGLRQFHQTPTAGLRRLQWSDEAAFLRRCQSTVGRLSPRRKRWVTNAIGALLRHERTAWGRGAGLVHKDFQASNIISGQPIGIIDFTLSGRGPIAFDVGTFLTHLEVMAYGHVDHQTVVGWQQYFLETYLRSVPARQRERLAEDVALFELRSALDIFAITLQMLGERHNPGKGYVHLLVQKINRLVEQLPRL